ncbi:MAG TPA: hypothetical protein DCR69_08875, partial [Clostridium sp.]|nr:hypothetical protein [Clostridium sp.]
MKKVSIGIGSKKIEDILGTVGSPSIVLSELIKNSIDSNSSVVDIYINTSRKEITVIDKGDGLDEIDIQKLGLIGESDKKEFGKEQRENGEYFSGSKGLGLLSAFSLSNYIEVETTKNNKTYLVKWEKAKGEFYYEEIKQLRNSGTKLTIKNISDDDIAVLTDEEEYKKLRHISLCHFKNVSNTSEKINFYINGNLKNEFTCCDIKDLESEFVYKIKFNYYSTGNKLEFKFDKVNMLDSDKINKGNLLPINRLLKIITINLDNNIQLNNIIKDNYRVTKTKTEIAFKYLDSNLEDFEGMFYITEGSKKNKNYMNQFGYGVKVFINNFAIYSFLDNENDWLGFGQLSQLGKSTTLKPHNVFGYINFHQFNEKKSTLKISNERTNFIEKAPYKKFIEIVKHIIVKIIFDIDVAYRNNYIETTNYSKDILNNNIEEKCNDKNTNDANLKNDNNINEHIHGIKNQSIKNAVKTNNSHSCESSKPHSIGYSNESLNIKENDAKANASPNKLNIKNPKKCKLGLKNKPKFNFFTISSIIKLNEPINIEYNELIKQLKKITQVKELDYKSYYLVFVMAFRSILEDISKTYINTRGLTLYGDLGQNVKAMTDDMLTIIKDTNFIDKNDKEEIERIF